MCILITIWCAVQRARQKCATLFHPKHQACPTDITSKRVVMVLITENENTEESRQVGERRIPGKLLQVQGHLGRQAGTGKKKGHRHCSNRDRRDETRRRRIRQEAAVGRQGKKKEGIKPAVSSA